MSSGRRPLVPIWVIVTVVLVVLGIWAVTVITALRNPANSGPLIPVTGLLTMVLGAAFGLLDNTLKRKDEGRAEEIERSKDEVP